MESRCLRCGQVHLTTESARECAVRASSGYPIPSAETRAVISPRWGGPAGPSRLEEHKVRGNRSQPEIEEISRQLHDDAQERELKSLAEMRLAEQALRDAKAQERVRQAEEYACTLKEREAEATRLQDRRQSLRIANERILAAARRAQSANSAAAAAQVIGREEAASVERRLRMDRDQAMRRAASQGGEAQATDDGDTGLCPSCGVRVGATARCGCS